MLRPKPAGNKIGEFMHNKTLRLIRITIVVVEKQVSITYSECVSVFVWLLWLYHIFLHYLVNFVNFRNKVRNVKHVF